jgi:hypothetical protein
MDSNLLKEAIADAKAVRQTALANAKVALEEAFTERYQAMFAEKLKEDAEQEVAEPHEETAGMNPAGDNVSEQEIDELIKELEAEVGQESPTDADDAASMGAVPPAMPGAVPPAMPGAVPPAMPGAVPPAMPGAAPQSCPPGCSPMGGAPMQGMPPMPGAPAPEMGGEFSQPSVPQMGGAVSPQPGAGTPPPSEVPPAENEADEDVDLNELLESLKQEIEQDNEEEEEEEGTTLDESTKLASSGIGGNKAGGSANKKPTSAASSSSKVESGGRDHEGLPKLDQPKTVAKEATEASRPNQAKNATKSNLSTPKMGAGNGSGGQSEDGMPSLDQPKVTAKEPTTASRPNQAKNATKSNLSTPGGALEENVILRKQLNEAEEVIKYVKDQLNEVNLLNAKLLYTNKLFKEFNMNKEQKMRVVEMFDLVKNVREVKLTYANIAESLNFGGTDIKRKTKNFAVTQSITEGLASGAVGSTKPSREIISEGKVNQMASRFQKLAGINLPKK